MNPNDASPIIHDFSGANDKLIPFRDSILVANDKFQNSTIKNPINSITEQVYPSQRKNILIIPTNSYQQESEAFSSPRDNCCRKHKKLQLTIYTACSLHDLPLLLSLLISWGARGHAGQLAAM